MTSLHSPSGGGYARGCRCDICRAAHRARHARRVAERADARTLQSGRLIAPVPADQHGKRATYINWLCRCEPCTAANAKKSAARRATA